MSHHDKERGTFEDATTKTVVERSCRSDSHDPLASTVLHSISG